MFPDVPTLDEAGLKGFDADTVFGFYAPAGTPADVVSRLNREINRILGTPAGEGPHPRHGRRGAAADAGRVRGQGDGGLQALQCDHQGTQDSGGLKIAPMAKEIVYTQRVEFGDCDPARIVWFPNFFRWIDAASRHFFVECGVPPWHETEKTLGIIGTPLVDTHAKFIKTASYGDVLQIHTSHRRVARQEFRAAPPGARGMTTLIMECDEVRIFAGAPRGRSHGHSRAADSRQHPRALRIGSDSDGAVHIDIQARLAHLARQQQAPQPGVVDRMASHSFPVWRQHRVAGNDETHPGAADCAEQEPDLQQRGFAFG